MENVIIVLIQVQMHIKIVMCYVTLQIHGSLS